MPAITIVRRLGFKKGSRKSAFAQVFIAFVISSCIHCWGDLALTGSFAYVGKSVPFYILNGAALAFEDVVIKLARMLGIPGGAWAKALGYVWVTTWMAWSGGFMLDWMLPFGVGRSFVLPFSIVRAVAPNAV